MSTFAYGPNFAGTVVNDPLVGDIAWNNPNDARITGTLIGSLVQYLFSATCIATPSGYCQRLKGYDFGTYLIPGSQAITGFSISFNLRDASSNTDNRRIEQAWMVHGGSVTTYSQMPESQYFAGAFATYFMGNFGNLFGVENWDMIHSTPNFGVAVSLLNENGTTPDGTFLLNSFGLTIYTKEPDLPPKLHPDYYI